MFIRYCRLVGLLLAAMFAGCGGMGNPAYQQVITEQKSIPQVSVKVSYKADGVYQVWVENELPDSINLLWDSSAYLLTGGDSVRVIQMEKIDAFPEEIKMAQENSVIASGERLKSYFVGERWLDYVSHGVTPRPKDKESKARIFIAFEIKGKRVYWKEIGRAHV